MIYTVSKDSLIHPLKKRSWVTSQFLVNQHALLLICVHMPSLLSFSGKTLTYAVPVVHSLQKNEQKIVVSKN